METPVVARGYTLNDLHVAALTVLRYNRAGALDRQTAYDVAWTGIAERIYGPGDPPTWQQLIRAGQRAVDREIRQTHQLWGVYERDPSRGAASSPGFLRYWRRPTSSLEDDLIERVAVWQILALLTPTERDALFALAVFGDYRAAADALGIRYDLLGKHVNKARRRFRQYWYAPDTPPPAMLYDRRVWRAAEPRTHCVHGHELTEENTYQFPRNRGSARGRLCRTCRTINKEGSRARYLRKKAASS